MLIGNIFMTTPIMQPTGRGDGLRRAIYKRVVRRLVA